MKSILLLICATGIIACSGHHKETPSSSLDTTPTNDSESSVNKEKSLIALTDKEKARITDEFLVSNAKELRNMKRDDCDMLTKSLQLLYARQIIIDRFAEDLPASSDISLLIKLLEDKITALACTTTMGGDITFGVKTSGGQVVFMKKMPMNTAIWAILSDDQRALMLQSVSHETKNQLLTMESKYADDIAQIKKTPTVKTVMRTADFSKSKLVKPR